MPAPISTADRAAEARQRAIDLGARLRALPVAPPALPPVPAPVEDPPAAATTADTRPPFAAIRAAVAEAFGVSVGDLVGTTRRGHVAVARQAAAYVAREVGWKYKEIIGSFSGCGHMSSLWFAIDAARKRVAADQEYRDRVRAVISALVGEVS